MSNKIQLFPCNNGRGEGGTHYVRDDFRDHLSGVQRFIDALGQTLILEKKSLFLPTFLMTLFSNLPQNIYLYTFCYEKLL